MNITCILNKQCLMNRKVLVFLVCATLCPLFFHSLATTVTNSDSPATSAGKLRDRRQQSSPQEQSRDGTDKKAEEVKGGELFCGTTAWDTIGGYKGLVDCNLVSPTRLQPLVGVDIRYVAAGCEGATWTWRSNST